MKKDSSYLVATEPSYLVVTEHGTIINKQYKVKTIFALDKEENIIWIYGSTGVNIGYITLEGSDYTNLNELVVNYIESNNLKNQLIKFITI